MHSRRLGGLPAIMIIGLTCAGVCAAQSTAPEFRAMWISRYEWPSGTEAQIKARLDAMMQNLADNHFNAVFLQVRGQADVLYPSPTEVWSPLINGGVDPGWDPLAYAIDAAHSRGIQFHAYINTHTCWQSSSQAEPANTNHVYYRHCRASDPDHRDWLIHNAAGEPVQWGESNYVWFAPGVPACQAYTREQVLYVVQNYDVDGVHFDRIRTPSAGYSYDPISQARRGSVQSNPGNLDFSHWTRDQITRQVRDMYAAIMAVKPNVVVSAAVFPNSATAPSSVNQDALTWAQTGGMDMLVPMIYTSGASGTAWDTQLQAWIAGSGGRQVVAGQVTSVGSAMLQSQVQLTRTRGGQGNSPFSYSSFTYWTDYLGNIYQVAVDPPEMSWKTNPTTAIIQGYVTNASNEAVVDAQVTRNGSDYIGLSSGDGYYSLLLVEPGAYTLQASHPAYGTTSVNVTVTAGQVLRQDLHLGSLLPPAIAEVSPDPDSVTVTRPYQRQLSIAQGSADSWTLLEGPTGATVSDTGMVSGWTPPAGTIGQSYTFTARATNAAGSDDETWQVQVAPFPACTIVKLTGFEGYSNGAAVLFQKPAYSGTTSAHVATSPNVAKVTDAVPAFKGSKTLQVQWQFVDATAQRWMRLTTANGASLPNPTIALDRPIRFRLRLDSGKLRVCVGIRETTTTAAIGENGGTTGSIEWIGASAVIDNAPQGVLVEGNPGVWQTLEFNPLTDPIRTYTGDGVLASDTGKGTFEHIAFSFVDSVGPFTVYLDDIDFGCYNEPFGDRTGDGYVDADDLLAFLACGSGPRMPYAEDCGWADGDADNDVDQADFARFQRCYSGTLPQTDPACAD
jgi:uncharacterized lipoprotein YddW (UPF0748 family)